MLESYFAFIEGKITPLVWKLHNYFSLHSDDWLEPLSCFVTFAWYIKSFYKHLHTENANNTQLSRHIWNLKENNTKFILKWNTLKICKSYSNLSNRYNLCSHEK